MSQTFLSTQFLHYPNKRLKTFNVKIQFAKCLSLALFQLMFTSIL